MKGSIEYMRHLRTYCKTHKGDCKRCPLGNKPNISDNICPRLLHPKNWTDEKILEMVRMRGANE